MLRRNLVKEINLQLSFSAKDLNYNYDYNYNCYYDYLLLLDNYFAIYWLCRIYR